MAVSNETIINKMMQELTKAKGHSQMNDDMLKHIEHVKLLCELLLGEEHREPIQTEKNKITASEMKAMMGKAETEITRPTTSKKTVVDHGEANGDSIFDF